MNSYKDGVSVLPQVRMRPYASSVCAATKTAFQCYLKHKLGVHATKLEIDGKFHMRSKTALQVLPVLD